MGKHGKPARRGHTTPLGLQQSAFIQRGTHQARWVPQLPRFGALQVLGVADERVPLLGRKGEFGLVGMH